MLSRNHELPLLDPILVHLHVTTGCSLVPDNWKILLGLIFSILVHTVVVVQIKFHLSFPLNKNLQKASVTHVKFSTIMFTTVVTLPNILTILAQIQRNKKGYLFDPCRHLGYLMKLLIQMTFLMLKTLCIHLLSIKWILMTQHPVATTNDQHLRRKWSNFHQQSIVCV